MIFVHEGNELNSASVARRPAVEPESCDRLCLMINLLGCPFFFFLTCIFLPCSFLLQVTYLITWPWLFPTFPKYLSPDRLETLLKCHFQELFGGRIVLLRWEWREVVVGWGCGERTCAHTPCSGGAMNGGVYLLIVPLFLHAGIKKKESIFSQRESRVVYCALKVSVCRLFLARP